MPDCNHTVEELSTEFVESCAKTFEPLFKLIYERQHTLAGSDKCPTNVQNANYAIYAAICYLKDQVSKFLELNYPIPPDLKALTENPLKLYPALSIVLPQLQRKQVFEKEWKGIIS